ncbi:MAG: TIGR00341 family protein [Bacteroidia bacterium]|nr:TIGR00341 family protein [Bacteroidia bacterium]
MAESNISIGRLWQYIRIFLKERFDLNEGEASEKQTIEEIKKGVIFKGANLWILIFAIMVASVGLNINSTAVIIGAMLISPLMGPIMGIGLGFGINDFELIVRALKNLGIAVAISVFTSALYFWISPLNDAQSELLARTSPTLMDVFIGLFGGLAGIVAGSRKEKSNAIPGVAIATALMPPLCTAGYGLATAQWSYFFGAFYLFFINSVFISLSTYLIVRALRYSPKEFMDEARERKVKRYIALLAILTIIPSVFTGWNMVRQSIFKRNANEFISQELNFEGCQIIFRKLDFDPDSSSIEVTLYGNPVSEEEIDEAVDRMPQYNLAYANLYVRQGYIENDSIDKNEIELMNERLRTGIIEDIYKKNEDLLKTKDAQIQLLENEILKFKAAELPLKDLAQEIKAINANVTALSVSPTLMTTTDSLKQDTVFLAYAGFRKRPTRAELRKLDKWLKVRVKTDKIKLLTR